jgi:hypothetical protein
MNIVLTIEIRNYSLFQGEYYEEIFVDDNNIDQESTQHDDDNSIDQESKEQDCIILSDGM